MVDRIVFILSSSLIDIPSNVSLSTASFIAEMLAIHFCSDRDETENVLRKLLERVETRIDAEVTVTDIEANPVIIFMILKETKILKLK